MNISKNLWSVLFGALLVVAISFYIYRDLHKTIVAVSNEAVSTSTLSVILETGEGAERVEGIPKYEVETVNQKPTPTGTQIPKTPDLSRSVINLNHLDENAFSVVAKNIANLTKELKADPKNYEKWLQLAVYRKMLADYDGSVEILSYVAIYWPNDYVAYNNLADLYQFYIHNYPQAEKNWLKVIDLKPDYEDAYVNLFHLYNDVYPGMKEKALPVLINGVSLNPKSISLLTNLARYYRGVGDKQKAEYYYNMAINKAVAQKNTQVEESLRAESTSN